MLRLTFACFVMGSLAAEDCHGACDTSVLLQTGNLNVGSPWCYTVSCGDAKLLCWKHNKCCSWAKHCVSPPTPTLEKLYVLGWVPYYTYDGPLVVTGSLEVGFQDTTSYLSWDLTGADANCMSSNSNYPNGAVSNDCGIHIHKGTSCYEDAEGHYWLPATDTDPWKTLHYSMQDGSTQSSNSLIDAGLTLSDATGHAVIVHDLNGGRIACGILMTSAEVAVPSYTVESLMPYPGYTGTLTTEGKIEMRTVGQTQYMTWTMTGGDSNCLTTQYPNGAISNDCGIHIHTGTTCDDASLVGGHFYNETMYNSSTDPWKHVHYQVWDGATDSKGTEVYTGLTESEIVGHAVVVHDVFGGRIACGILTAP